MAKQTKSVSHFILDGVKYPNSLGSSIIFRALGENVKAFAEFHEDYCNARLKAGNRVASEQDLKIFADYKKNLMLMSELAKKYKMSYARVSSAIVRASRVA